MSGGDNGANDILSINKIMRLKLQNSYYNYGDVYIAVLVITVKHDSLPELINLSKVLDIIYGGVV